MATVTIMTGVEFTDEMSDRFLKEAGEAIEGAFQLGPNMSELFLCQLPKHKHTPMGDGRITFFIYTAPKKIEYRREVVHALQDLVRSYFPDKDIDSVVIIKEHEDEFVGFKGDLKSDLH